MKAKAGSKKKTQTRGKLNFVRVFPFYVRHGAGSWHFEVTVTAYHGLNAKTGMSVDLVTFNKVAESIFKNTKLNNSEIVPFLFHTIKILKRKLAEKGIEFVSGQFDECRGLGFCFKNNDIFFVRKDFATDKCGDLFQVTSHFGSQNTLVEMTMNNFKDQIKEQIIY